MELEVLNHIRYLPNQGIFIWLSSGMRRRQGSIAGHTSKTGYVVIPFKGKAYRAHRLAYIIMTGNEPTNYIDHINGKRLDNRWENLRDVTMSDNAKNRYNVSSKNKIGLTGVSWDRNKNKWVAYINIDGKQTRLGRFSCLLDAAACRITNAKKHAYNISKRI